MFNIDIQIYLHCAEILKTNTKIWSDNNSGDEYALLSVKLNTVHILFPVLRMLSDSELIL